MSWVWYNYARFHQKGTNNGKKSRLALKSVFLDLKSSDFRWKGVLFSSGIRVFFKLGNRHDARFGREWRGGGVRPNKHYYEQTVAVVWDATTFMRRHYNAKACPKTDISRAITLIMEISICCLQKKFYPYDVRPLVNLSQWCFTSHTGTPLLWQRGSSLRHRKTIKGAKSSPAATSNDWQTLCCLLQISCSRLLEETTTRRRFIVVITLSLLQVSVAGTVSSQGQKHSLANWWRVALIWRRDST